MDFLKYGAYFLVIMIVAFFITNLIHIDNGILALITILVIPLSIFLSLNKRTVLKYCLFHLMSLLLLYLGYVGFGHLFSIRYISWPVYFFLLLLSPLPVHIFIFFSNHKNERSSVLKNSLGAFIIDSIIATVILFLSHALGDDTGVLLLPICILGCVVMIVITDSILISRSKRNIIQQ